jgi:hypothetical protein
MPDTKQKVESKYLLLKETFGKYTCAAIPGVFCKHVTCRIDGSLCSCSLFKEPLSDYKGWLQRCKPCLAAEYQPPKKEEV